MSPLRVSDSKTDSSTKNTTTSSPPPSFRKFERYFTSLVGIARQTINPVYTTTHRPSTFLAIDKLLNIQDRLDVFFAKCPDYDWVGDASYRLVLEMQILMRMVEIALALRHSKIAWPQACGSGEEAKAMQKGAYEHVEVLVFARERMRKKDMLWM
ncbi:uncharacterized protein K460DRAFT_405312 [Cucurbitaria berberidis CBS 394.84]|uniref:Uncharacterized protein n=1 Tax=Cucurbitaria berberidis CBS 394.84 TaxID=1168544 RepID=A0A9P4L898_9PLEO|nr:uncharacterized protein K460DRAFT_405312 [Cucurbitaria berberidis CBS 394.84]KAF1845033.1 hypothetical protein K460DRAFT_405312 [Cucurbitaria berberidis CBS 394.84]